MERLFYHVIRVFCICQSLDLFLNSFEFVIAYYVYLACEFFSIPSSSYLYILPASSERRVRCDKDNCRCLELPASASMLLPELRYCVLP